MPLFLPIDLFPPEAVSPLSEDSSQGLRATFTSSVSQCPPASDEDKLVCQLHFSKKIKINRYWCDNDRHKCNSTAAIK